MNTGLTTLQKKNMKTHFENIDKIAKGRCDETDYSYLNYCFCCGKQIRWFDAFVHGFEGNAHRFGCGFIPRFLGSIAHFIYLICAIIILIICSPFLLIKYVIDKLKNQEKK